MIAVQRIAAWARRQGCQGSRGQERDHLRYVLPHIVPAEIDEPATIESLHRTSPGRVTVAHDLLEVAPGREVLARVAQANPEASPNTTAPIQDPGRLT